MDFVLVLHSHLPYVLNHGRWPHGSDWLCEAAVDTYLPLYETLARLARRGIPAPITLGITPVLANQLASPAFADELERFFAQRMEHCREAIPSLKVHDANLLPLVEFWEQHLGRLLKLFRSLDRDLAAAFRGLEEQGAIELISSGATHGYLPLLGRDESIRLQLLTGKSEHRRLFGSTPRGCWLPECAYRPKGRWDPLPGVSRSRNRTGIDEFLGALGYRYFITDAHLAQAGNPLEQYGPVPGAERFDIEAESDVGESRQAERTPYRAYRVTPPSAPHAVAALVRDPYSTKQVWSRHQGYPGDKWYLEFHKIRWPHGLKLWRVTGPSTDLGLKQPYQPEMARHKVEDHASHFAHTLKQIAATENGDGVIVAPFDTELFGHWWFEGVDFMGAVYRRLYTASSASPGRSDGEAGTLKPVTGSQHLKAHPPKRAVQLAAGSWGAHGDNSMWLNHDTEWTWRRMWPLEDRFWKVAPKALAVDAAHPVLAQAARELLLAQSSDWQFIISTGVVRDYGERRFVLHCNATERLLSSLEQDPSSGHQMAEELGRRDDLFPNVLDAVAAAIGKQRVRG
jgi:1,4-alpha-glucan branching enzyme